MLDFFKSILKQMKNTDELKDILDKRRGSQFPRITMDTRLIEELEIDLSNDDQLIKEINRSFDINIDAASIKGILTFRDLLYFIEEKQNET